MLKGCTSRERVADVWLLMNDLPYFSTVPFTVGFWCLKVLDRSEKKQVGPLGLVLMNMDKLVNVREGK